MSIASRLGPLAEREFRLLFLGRTTSLLGSAFAPVALAFAVLDDLDGSASALGLVLAAIWVPQVVLILVGGVWADRLPRNFVMVGTDLVMCAAQATVAALLITGAAQLWHLFALQLVRGTANAFFFPASSGLVPQVVSAGRLQQANALLRLSHSGTAVVGAAAAGILVAAAGSGAALAFDAATFLVSALFLARIRVPGVARARARNFAGELREGWREVASRPWLWSIVVQFMFLNAFAHGTFLVLGPVVAEAELGGASAWGAILACEAAGMAVGALLVLRFRPRRILLVATLALFLAVPEYGLLALPAPLVLIAAGAVLAGVAVETFGVLWDTALQQQIPRDRLSRVYSFDALGSFVCIPIGMSIAGPLGAALGIRTTLLLAGGVVAVTTLAVLLVRDVRGLRRTDERLPVPTGAAVATEPT
ncbi:MAG: MFS transporter [Thermoleophilia bacterium]|nr:MFS transporter [Thermoleophilia bacterium]